MSPNILIIAETKIDETFPTNQFLLSTFKVPYRLDKSNTSGGILAYIHIDISSKRLNDLKLPIDFQAIPFEISLKNSKWLVVAVYNPHKQLGRVFLDNLSTLLDFYLRKYDNYLIIGDMNLQPQETIMFEFLENNCLHNLIKDPTCFKTPMGTCIDLILTNKEKCFKFSNTLETGLSDCHKLISTTFKSNVVRLPPIKKVYRDFRHFEEDAFLKDVKSHLTSNNFLDFQTFYDMILRTLNSHAPFKEKLIRGNNKPFINKAIRKELMKRARLKNKANKTGLNADMLQFKRQRNYVTSLVRKSKRNYFSKIEISDDKKTFWKAIKPYLSNKTTSEVSRFALEINGLSVTKEIEVANIFNDYFCNITSKLNLTLWQPDIYLNVNSSNLLFPEFCGHPSILKISEHYRIKKVFDFKHVVPETVFKVINDLKKGDASLPLNIIKSLSKSFCNSMCDLINSSINNCCFPDNLKWADITPIHKKGPTSNHENYRPISILPTFSKVFERIIFDQINEFFEEIFSKYLCGFRKGYSTQTALIRLLQKWQSCLDQKGVIGTVLIDLSKAYDCIQHNLLLAKLEAYGFSRKSIKLLKSYLSGRKQRVKILSSFSNWLWINFGIPQGSILGPLLFNIFINDLFLFIEESEICNFADDNTLYVCNPFIENVINSLQKDLDNLNNLNKWLTDNSLVANPSKFQLMFLGLEENNFTINMADKVITSQNQIEILGITIDKKLSFSAHIKRICKSANNKICAILRLRNLMSIEQTKLLVNAHVLSHFHYCPLIWMFCLKKDMNLITTVHKRALRTIYNNFYLTYEELLDLSKSFSIHQKHLQYLMIEIFKCTRQENPLIFRELFQTKDQPYNLRNNNLLKLPLVSTTKFGTNSLIFKGSLIWNALSNSMKNSNSLSIFKREIRNLEISCTCSICK